MRLKRSYFLNILLILFSLLLSACGGIPEIPELMLTKKPTIPYTDEARKIGNDYLSKETVEANCISGTCEARFENLTVTNAEEWRYGYFCGEGHPELDRPELDKEQRIALYVQLEPHDDLDRTCQGHDICWIAHGHGNGTCNREFQKSLDYLYDKFRRYKEYEKHCEYFTQQMHTVFSTFFVENNEEDPISDATDKIFRTGFTPALAGLTGLMIFLNGLTSESIKDDINCSLLEEHEHL